MYVSSKYGKRLSWLIWRISGWQENAGSVSIFFLFCLKNAVLGLGLRLGLTLTLTLILKQTPRFTDTQN